MRAGGLRAQSAGYRTQGPDRRAGGRDSDNQNNFGSVFSEASLRK